jgi:hypothetical protein
MALEPEVGSALRPSSATFLTPGRVSGAVSSDGLSALAPSSSSSSPRRDTSFDFTGCLSYIEVLTLAPVPNLPALPTVLRLNAMLLHNDACQTALFPSRLPKVPLHQEVYEEALELLDKGSQTRRPPSLFIFSTCRSN